MNNYKPAMKQDVVVLRFVGYIKSDDLSCDIMCQQYLEKSQLF